MHEVIYLVHYSFLSQIEKYYNETNRGHKNVQTFLGWRLSTLTGRKAPRESVWDLTHVSIRRVTGKSDSAASATLLSIYLQILETLDNVKLIALITTFVTNNKFIQSEIFILLDNILEIIVPKKYIMLSEFLKYVSSTQH